MRTFLVTALKHFMAKQWRRANAQRRGGGLAPVPFDSTFAESRYAADATTALAADAVFDREWALTLLDLTLRRLETEFAAAGRVAEFAVLKSCLVAAHGALDYSAVAARLGLREGAARVAVHRLRKRFRQIYRDELAQTLDDGADLDAELRHLAGALAQG